MRKIILFMVLSLDGYIGGPNGELDWEIRDEEIGRYLIKDLLKTVDSMILGRVLYQGFSEAWPAMAADPKSSQEIVDFANWVENSPKYVFSRTLEKADWKNSKLFRVNDDAEFIHQVEILKQSEGKDIVLFGGARMAHTMVRLNLVDEYRFKVQPVILGKGLQLFNDLEKRINLKLIESKVFDSGVVALYYQPK